MSFLNIFPYLVAILDVAAAIIYFRQGKTALGITWLLYAGACISLAKVGE